MSDYKKTVCVDLDGVLADYSKGWRGVNVIGDPIPGAAQFTHDLSKFARVVIYTTRCKGKLFDRDEPPEKLVGIVREWLDRHGFSYDDIDSGQGKPIFAATIDDRAITCRPQSPFVNDMEGGLPQLWADTLLHAKNFCEAH